MPVARPPKSGRRRSRQAGLAALTALSACAAPPQTSTSWSGPAPSHQAVRLADGCPARILRAAALDAEHGKLWSAKRALDRCPKSEDSELALAGVEAALGDWKSAESRLSALGTVDPKKAGPLRDRIREQRVRSDAGRVDGDAGATLAQELKDAERALLRGECALAGDRVKAAYLLRDPHPDAALLAARAAACQGDRNGESLWYARATFELQQAFGKVSWLLVRIAENANERCVRFLDTGELVVDGEYPSSRPRPEFRSISVKEDWAYHMRAGSRQQKGRWRAAGYRFDRVDEQLVATKEATGEVAWRLPLDEEAHTSDLAPGLGERGLIEFGNFKDAWTARWRRIDVDSGKAGPYRLASNLRLPLLKFSSPDVDWFVFRSTTLDHEDFLYHVVDASGRVKTWPSAAWPSDVPLLAWDDSELLVGDADRLWAVNVWTSKRRMVARVPGEIGRIGTVVRGSDGVIYLEGQAGNGYLKKEEWDPEVEMEVVPFEPRALQTLMIDDWSAGAERVVGRRRNEPWAVEVWNLKRKQREYSLTTLIDRPKAAVDPEGRRLGLAYYRNVAQVEFASRRWEYAHVPSQDRWFQPLYTNQGMVLAPRMWLWPFGGALQEPRGSRVLARGKWLAGGPWVAPASVTPPHEVWLPDRPNHPVPLGLDGVRLRQLAPRGDHAVVSFVDKERRLRAGVIRLTQSPPRSELLWSQEAAGVEAVFSRDGRLAYISTKQGWIRVSLPHGKAEAIEAPWPAVPIQLARDGKRVLLPDGIAIQERGEVLALEGLPERAEDEPSPLLAFVQDDQLVVGVTEQQIALWNSSDGRIVGQLIPVGSAWAFTRDRIGAEGKGPVELFGDTSEVALLCAAGDRVYPWAVCSDYFVQPGLFSEILPR